MQRKQFDPTSNDIDEINKSENEIKIKLGKNTTFKGNYEEYVYIDNNWYQQYKKYLIEQKKYDFYFFFLM